MDNDDINLDLSDEPYLEKIAQDKKALRTILDSYISGSKILVNRMHMGKTLEVCQNQSPLTLVHLH